VVRENYFFKERKNSYNEITFDKDNHNNMRRIPFHLLACLIICATAVLASACDIQISLDDAQPSPAAATATIETEKTGQVPLIGINLNGLAQAYTTHLVEAAPAAADIPTWDILPAHTVISLNGYVIQSHMHKAQLIIYPVGELAKFNEGAGRKADELRALLQTKQTGERMPFLPLFNAAQVMRAQVKYLDFANGTGVRFLTQFDQAPIPINNRELFYSFQGLTYDGKYYLAVILPVNHPSLPADEMVNATDMDAYMQNFRTNMNAAVATLEQQPANSFTPDLARLDEMIRSIEIK